MSVIAHNMRDSFDGGVQSVRETFDVRRVCFLFA